MFLIMPPTPAILPHKSCQNFFIMSNDRISNEPTRRTSSRRFDRRTFLRGAGVTALALLAGDRLLSAASPLPAEAHVAVPNIPLRDLTVCGPTEPVDGHVTINLGVKVTRSGPPEKLVAEDVTHEFTTKGQPAGSGRLNVAHFEENQTITHGQWLDDQGNKTGEIATIQGPSHGHTKNYACEGGGSTNLEAIEFTTRRKRRAGGWAELQNYSHGDGVTDWDYKSETWPTNTPTPESIPTATPTSTPTQEPTATPGKGFVQTP